MTIDQVIHTIISWDTLLSKGMKKYIHYYSMRNFAIHYPEIPDQEALKHISDLLTLYVEEVIANNYNFNSKSGYYLGEKYLNKLSPYYRSMLNFNSRLQFKYVLLLGIPADGLLYITGISTFLKEPKGYVYGFFY